MRTNRTIVGYGFLISFRFTALILALFIFQGCQDKNKKVQTEEVSFESPEEYIREIYIAGEASDMDSIIRNILFPASEGNMIFEVELTDAIYKSKLTNLDSPENYFFFTKNRSEGNISLCFVIATPSLSSIFSPNPHLYELFNYQLRGDTILSLFFYKTKDEFGPKECFVTISKTEEDYFTETEEAYFTDVFYPACGMRYCSLEWENSEDQFLYSKLSKVRNYEDFKRIYPTINNSEKEQNQ